MKAINADDLRYPVVCFGPNVGDTFEVKLDPEGLTTTTALTLKKRGYDGTIIVDSGGRACQVREARKLRGVGLFRGYNLFLNQWIKVELIMDGKYFEMPTSEVRERVLRAFDNSIFTEVWDSGEPALTQIKQALDNAQTSSEIIQVLAQD